MKASLLVGMLAGLVVPPVTITPALANPPKKLVCSYTSGDTGLIGDGTIIQLDEQRHVATIPSVGTMPTTVPVTERTTRFDENGVEMERTFDFGGSVIPEYVYRINRYTGSIDVWEFDRNKSDGRVVKFKIATGRCQLSSQRF